MPINLCDVIGVSCLQLYYLVFLSKHVLHLHMSDPYNMPLMSSMYIIIRYILLIPSNQETETKIPTRVHTVNMANACLSSCNIRSDYNGAAGSLI